MNLFKNTTFFIQTVFPIIIILVTIILIGSVIIPIVDTAIQNDDNIKNSLASLTINTEVLGIILCISQVIFSISSLSVTAISREGREAILINSQEKTKYYAECLAGKCCIFGPFPLSLYIDSHLALPSLCEVPHKDGWGEGLEQQAIHVDGGELYVHL